MPAGVVGIWFDVRNSCELEAGIGSLTFGGEENIRYTWSHIMPKPFSNIIFEPFQGKDLPNS